MGQGYGYKCKKCGQEYNVLTGIGMMYSQLTEDTLNRIKAGDFGDEYKQLVEENPNLRVDCTRNLYLCKKCGHWGVRMTLSLYDFNEDGSWHIVKEYNHICPNCNEPLEHVPDNTRVKCPTCGYLDDSTQKDLDNLPFEEWEEEIKNGPRIIMWD